MSEDMIMIYPTDKTDRHQKMWLVLKCSPDRGTIIARIFSQEPPLSALKTKDGGVEWEIISGEIAVDLFDDEELSDNQ